VRTARHKFAFYFDPVGRAAREYEMYDLERDPDESANLVDRATGEPVASDDRELRSELGERLRAVMAANGSSPELSAASSPGAPARAS
jgi:hypothetical protein